MNNIFNMNMDSVTNELRSTVATVASTVSQLSVVLPGNPVTREFEISQHIGSSGPGLMWKIYSGFKKSTQQEAAIFVFEKKQLDKWPKRDGESMIETLKKGVSQLTRLRHPRFLTVQHPLEESRDTLAFATEPVFASLANVMGCFDNMPQPVDPELKKYSLRPIDVKLGLLQICEGLTFLHGTKILHGNVCPESIIINQHGAWKIFGLDFSLTSSGAGAEGVWTPKEYDQEGQPRSQQHLDFLAPEYTKLTCSTASDMYSLGMLSFAAFNDGKALYINCGSWQIYKQNIEKLHDLSESRLQAAPPEMRNFIRRLVNFSPQQRPDSHEFSKWDALHDEGVKTLDYRGSLFQRDDRQKCKFYKGLDEMLPSLPQRVRVQRVVPCLAQEFVNPSMVPFVLPIVLKIAEWATNEEYVRHILPHLRDVMKLREPVKVLCIFMKNMETLIQKSPPDVTKHDVLPLIYGSLESDSIQVQELCLAIIPGVAGLIDASSMESSLLPRILNLCLNSNAVSVRVNCLICLGKMLDCLDYWLIKDYILPFLTEIHWREPPVIMEIIGIYRLAVNHKKLGVSKETIATDILPFVFPLIIENGLTPQQFSTIMNFVYELVKKVEVEHKIKLEEIEAVGEELKREQEQEKIQEKLDKTGFADSDDEDRWSITVQVGAFGLVKNVKLEHEIHLEESAAVGEEPKGEQEKIQERLDLFAFGHLDDLEFQHADLNNGKYSTPSMTAKVGPWFAPPDSRKGNSVSPQKPQTSIDPTPFRYQVQPNYWVGNVRLPGELLNDNLENTCQREMQAKNVPPSARSRSSMSMPMGMSSIAKPPQLQQKPMLTSYYTSPSNNLNSFQSTGVDMSNILIPQLHSCQEDSDSDW